MMGAIGQIKLFKIVLMTSLSLIYFTDYFHDSYSHMYLHTVDLGSEILLLQPFGGDESGCVKPWLGAVKTPKNPPPINPGVPAIDVELSWIHGYTSGTPCKPFNCVLCFVVLN